MNTSTMISSRGFAAKALVAVLCQGHSLTKALTHINRSVKPGEVGFCKHLCFGVLRFLPQLSWELDQYIKKPLKASAVSVKMLLLTALFQIHHLNLPDHLLVNETVKACEELGFAYLKALVNGVLRKVLRAKESGLAKLSPPEGTASHLHPQWMVDRLYKTYSPEVVVQILAANNQQAPMWLRVNLNRCTREAYQLALSSLNIAASPDGDLSSSAIKLAQPVPVEKLPSFSEGAVSVQDLSAQQCPKYLQPHKGSLLLDLCAAPGGKLTHLLSLYEGVQALAVDISSERLQFLQIELARLALHAETLVGDGRALPHWAIEHFDYILLDAPCSGSGVIRRHPDSKWLKRASDLVQWTTLQAELLTAAWRYLKPGGHLLYATCSVFEEENALQIKAFLQDHPDAAIGQQADTGELAIKQILPHIEGGDGFFYACLEKRRG